MSRTYNFCAGPAALPTEVLQQASDEMLDWHGKGMSVMEMSHRSQDVIAVVEQAEQDLRSLMKIPNDYRVIFMQGGATSQFAMVPMNLANGSGKVDQIVTGQWSKKALAEGQRFADVQVAATTADNNFTSAPSQQQLQLRPDADYLHYCPNETIGGVAFDYIPESGDVPLVADLSSAILSQPLDVARFGMIYAGAQKNIGPAGLCVVIVRDDLIGKPQDRTPTMFDYKVSADAGSMYNTPASYSIYLAGLVFQWLKRQGGVEAMAAVNQHKAASLYDYIDGSEFYANPVAPINRSIMNVPFTLRDASLDKQFLTESEAAGLMNLAGHRSVGGMRASIYNAVPEAAVAALIQFMDDFARRYG